MKTKNAIILLLFLSLNLLFLALYPFQFENKNEKVEKEIKTSIIEKEENKIDKNAATFTYTIYYNDQVFENWYFYKELSSNPFYNWMSEYDYKELEDWINNYIIESLISFERPFDNFSVKINNIRLYENLKEIEENEAYMMAYNLKYETQSWDNLCWYFPPLTKHFLESINDNLEILNNNENYTNSNFVLDSEVDEILLKIMYEDEPDYILKTPFNSIELKSKYLEPVPCKL